MKEQMVISKCYEGGELEAFMRYPGSYRLQEYLEQGWTLKEMHIAKDETRGWFLLEREITWNTISGLKLDIEHWKNTVHHADEAYLELGRENTRLAKLVEELRRRLGEN